jgi:hypothetical protein
METFPVIDLKTTFGKLRFAIGIPDPTTDVSG